MSSTLAIRVKFPASTQHDAIHGLGDLESRTGPLREKLRPKTVSHVKFFLVESAEVDGYGQPFSNPGHPSEQWLFANAPIVGDVTLETIFALEEFEFIVPKMAGDTLTHKFSFEELGPPVGYPYGPKQDWALSTTGVDSGDWDGTHYPPAFSFPDDETTVAVNSQSVFQDYFWLQMAADRIFWTKLSLYLVPFGKGDPARMKLFFVVVHLPDNYEEGLEDAWRTFLKGASLEIQFTDGPTWNARVEEAPRRHKVLEQHGAKDNDRLFLLAQRAKDFEWKTFESGVEARQALKQGVEL